MRLEAKEKTLQMNSLKTENERLRLANSSESVDNIAKLIVERDNYQKRCDQMEKFLSDYGLKWVGDDMPISKEAQKDFKADDIKRELDHRGPDYRNRLPKEIDTAVLTRRIEELNFIAEKSRFVTNA